MSAQLRIQLFDRLVNRNNGTALRVIQLHAWGITGIDDAGRMQDLRMDSALAHDWMLYVPVAYDGGDNPEVDHRIWERYPGW